MSVPDQPQLQLVLLVPCHPFRHRGLREHPLGSLEAGALAVVARGMAQAWTTTRVMCERMGAEGWQIRADAVSSDSYLEIRASSPAGLSHMEALRSAHDVVTSAQRSGIIATLGRSDSAPRSREPVLTPVGADRAAAVDTTSGSGAGLPISCVGDWGYPTHLLAAGSKD